MSSVSAQLGLSIVLLSGCGAGPGNPPAVRSQESVRETSFVGRQACSECHPEQVELWRGSHHDRAMQVADASTVLGDFDNAVFTYATSGTSEVTTTFFRRDGQYLVRTDGPDGELADFRVAYVFGVEPLQQYLLELPGGRLQALAVSWDTRPASDGGQRWFHLYPDEDISPGDDLHWTGSLLNWNYMCAECHSTNVERNYRSAESRYETTFSEIDVSCEACHGPGSSHVEWAKNAASGAAGDDPSLGLVAQLKDEGTAFWAFDGESGTVRRSAPRRSRTEIETCGRCHARRTPVAAEYLHGRPLAESHRIALLDQGLYHPDGQIDDEVYVYGSFLQSKMYHEGVTCTDCHDPHSAGLVAEGNAVCARCHLPAKFEAPEHHHHSAGGAGSRCVDCHMPAKTYMVVDPRRDHSFRVPRPDLSVKIGTPNACTGCHRERDDRWAAEAVTAWYGPERAEAFHYGEALHAGRHWLPEADRMLRRVADDPRLPDIARASAISLLRRYPGPGTTDTLKAAVNGGVLMRYAAAGALEAVEGEERLRLGFRLLQDPALTVRLQAAWALLSVPPRLLSAEQAPALELALEEYADVQRNRADRAEAHLNLGWLHMQRGEPELAEEAYRTAIRIEPSYAFSYINLADLRRAQDRDDEGEILLRRAIEFAPESGDAYHALGLWQVRQQRPGEALESLARAVELRPEEPYYAYVHGVALQNAGEIDRALAVLGDASRRYPAHRELLRALIAIYRDLGDFDMATDHARRLLALTPWDPAVRQFLEQGHKAADATPGAP